MGIKRPLEDEEFLMPAFGLPKEIDYNKRLNLNIEDSHIGGPKSYFCKLQYDKPIDDGETDSAYIPDKESEASQPLSLVTSTSSEEDSGDRLTFFWPYFPGNDFTIPRGPPELIENPYISLLNGPPRKEVPVGSAYQAEIPMWDPNGISKKKSRSNYFSDNKCEQELTRTCIIRMSDLNDSTLDGLRAGRGRTDCNCLDMGSMRCVRQHVNEVREKLRESIGDENFIKLGFNEMGDEVAHKWSCEDERVFHEIVFSNPVMFWKHLRAEFPARKMKELVSYYFNVFMLRRRAVQNRSFVLEIDSDDDEEQQGSNEDFYQNGFYSRVQDMGNNDYPQGQNGECYFVVREEDDDNDDSTVESFGGEDLDASWVDEFWSDAEKMEGGHKASKLDNGIIGDINVDKKDAFQKVLDEPGF
ncbi:hypothetical protein OROMI_010091 [Orobanche minor]